MKTTIYLQTLCVSVLFFLFTSSNVRANVLQGDIPLDECKKLMIKGAAETEKGHYTNALEYWIKAEAIIEKGKYKNRRFFIKNNIGIIYDHLSNHGEALNYYQQALEICKIENKEDDAAKVLNNIGAVYAREEDYETAIEYYKKAYRIAKERNLDVVRTSLAQNFSDIYNTLGDYKQARKYLEEVKNIPISEKQRQLLEINYAESFIVEGKTKEAQKMIEQLMANVNKEKGKGCYVCIVELLSDIYSKQNKFDMAVDYAKKGIKNTSDLNDRITFFRKLSDIYTKKVDYITALKYKDSVILTKDSLSGAINRELFETNKVKLKVQDYQNELKNSNEKHDIERKLFIAGIVISLVLISLIYRTLKNRIIKQKQEKTIAENQQKIYELELDNLKNNVAEKNRKLSAKALYLSGRNEIIEEIINSLGHLPEVSQNREVTNYIKTLKEYLKTDAEWDDFITYFEQVNHDFFRALKTKHPDLTPQDIRFLCYIYMNLDIKEISNIFSITSEAGRKRKQRIAKKMGIDIDGLHEYILKIH